MEAKKPISIYLIRTGPSKKSPPFTTRRPTTPIQPLPSCPGLQRGGTPGILPPHLTMPSIFPPTLRRVAAIGLLVLATTLCIRGMQARLRTPMAKPSSRVTRPITHRQSQTRQLNFRAQRRPVLAKADLSFKDPEKGGGQEDLSITHSERRRRIAIEQRKKDLEAELVTLQRELEGKPREKQKIQSLPCDYGYLAKTAGRYYVDGPNSGPPSSALEMARKNFVREFQEMIKFFTGQQDDGGEDDACAITEDVDGTFDKMECIQYRAELKKLSLSNDAVWEREEKRPEIEAPVVIKVPYYLLCYMLDFLFDGRPLERFWFLETVARMPYLSYVTMLHLYESFGWWRRAAAIKRIHFAEEWNEFHHLLIFEALGGDRSWLTRFFAQHAAIVYYWVLVVMWLLSPTLAYNFSELIEAHAVDTYGEFADANEDLMKSLPAPAIAIQYYMGGDMYLYDEFQSERDIGDERRPEISNLHDVICAIRDDEAEHVNTMAACQNDKAVVQSINVERALLIFGGAYLLTRSLFQPEEAIVPEDAVAGIGAGFLTPLLTRLNELRQTVPEGWVEQVPSVLKDLYPALPDGVVEALAAIIIRVLPLL
ncbi:hypothetical protein AAMO2058_000034300 [Amorphochlora amoebiformis]